MNLVLCMAGLYQRFRNAGYTTPKFLLPWQQKTILYHVLKPMLQQAIFTKLLLIANKRDQFYTPVLHAILNDFPDIAKDIYFVNDTKGQAETALIACQYLKEQSIQEEKVLFHNIDTILLERNYLAYAAILANCNGLIDVFFADLPCYSYVDLDAKGRVLQIAEKVVISPYATSGLYGFNSYHAYLDYYHQAKYTKEYYISDIYQCMLNDNCCIVAPNFKQKMPTIVLGTPQEYEQAVKYGT